MLMTLERRAVEVSGGEENTVTVYFINQADVFDRYSRDI